MKFSSKTRGRSRSLIHILRACMFFPLNNETSLRPVIIVGAPNSGTTMFADALDLHPELVNRSEERVLWDPEFHNREMKSDYLSAQDATAWRKFVIKGNFTYFHRRFSKKRVVNKHPENSLRLEFIREIFPEAFYVHLIRDGRAVVNSNLARKKPGIPFANWVVPADWKDFAGNDPVEQYAHMWKACVDSIQSIAPDLKNFREIRYEKLAENQDRTYLELFEWLGLHPDEEVISMIPKVENRNFKWKERLTPDQVEMISKYAGDTLHRNGYGKEASGR
jgi:hypothetical protein